ncbi:recombinase family protein [Legionella pneumophila serogroup 1]|uniref:recombinase family protein n=1 Tax=Legionella pneumophila TaxID=446 RepID=UPI0007785F6F|nr:recombinase family protein [Legionella pneumophila]HAT8623601.1 helix-turn-helix domain-containing protein [Legionella pneumophila]HAU1410601.1 recombinase family protein [Legionella pneumophila]HCC3170914.1 recombinase family protein [Legionella pneumophila]HCC3179981.1 recombinase family protein [Legionella pneumophila]HCC3186129.1 recombinase family protein [Legionella pneumophila]
MAFIGYARVSTIDQNLDIQLDALKKAGCKKIFSEKKSGASKKDRTALDECMEYIREGDTLVVTRIDRLTRSILDLQNLLHYLKEKEIHLKALEQPIDTSNASGKFFLDMLGVFAEFETNLRRERQLEGIERAKLEGKYKGRKPTARSKSDEVMELVSQGFTRTAIAKKLNIGIASVYRILKNHRQNNPNKTIPGSQSTKKIAVVEVRLRVGNNNKFVRGKNESRRQIEKYCFSSFDMVKKDKDGWEYILKVPYANEQDLDEAIYDLMYAAESIAECRNGFTEMSVVEPATGKSW